MQAGKRGWTACGAWLVLLVWALPPAAAAPLEFRLTFDKSVSTNGRAL